MDAKEADGMKETITYYIARDDAAYHNMLDKIAAALGKGWRVIGAGVGFKGSKGVVILPLKTIHGMVIIVPDDVINDDAPTQARPCGSQIVPTTSAARQRRKSPRTSSA